MMFMLKRLSDDAADEALAAMCVAAIRGGLDTGQVELATMMRVEDQVWSPVRRAALATTEELLGGPSGRGG